LIGHDLGSYAFDAVAKTVTLSGIPAITQDQILLVTNTKTGAILYNFADPATGGTLVGLVLTLLGSTAGMTNSDPLQVYVDLPSDGVVLYVGDISAASTSPIFDTSGFQSLTLHLTGAWLGSVCLEGSNDQVLNNFEDLLLLDSASLVPSDTATVNGVYTAQVSTRYATIEVPGIQGTVHVVVIGRQAAADGGADRVALALDPSTGVALSTVVQNLKMDAQKALVPSDMIPTFFQGAVGSVLILDTTGYATLTIDTDATAAGTVQQSNDGIRWKNLGGALTTAASPAPPATQTLAASGTYLFPAAARYIKVTLTAAGCLTCYLGLMPYVPGIQLQDTNVSRIGQTAVPSAGTAGVMPVGGLVAQAAAPGTTFPNVIAGVDNSVTSLGAANPLVRRVLTDTAGRVFVDLVGIDQLGIARPIGAVQPGYSQINQTAIPVSLVDSVEGQTLLEVNIQQLLELRIIAHYLFDLARQLQSPATALSPDEPAAFRGDPTIFQ
jgi:hypothetical protein